MKTRRCIFCSSSSNSREHVFPEWFSKAAGIRHMDFAPAHFSTVGGCEVQTLTKCRSLTVRCVCKTCNNGWMSELENQIKARLEVALKLDWKLSFTLDDLEPLRADVVPLIRWMLKTAVMIELAFPRGVRGKVNPEAYPIARGSVAPADFHVWGAYVIEPSFLVHLSPGFPVWNGGRLQPHQVHKRSMDFALQINHLALRLFCCPEARPGLKLPLSFPSKTPGSPVYQAVPLQISGPVEFPFLPAHVYPTFVTFLDALEVWTGQPPADEERL